MLVNGNGVAWKGDQEGYQIDDIQAALKFIKTVKFKKIEVQEDREISKEIEDSDREFNVDLRAALESMKARESSETEAIELDDPRKPGIATLGALKQHPRISAFRRFIEGWYLSYLTPDAARSLPLAGPQEHLNIHGDNLSNVVQFMERQHPSVFKSILKKSPIKSQA